MESTVDRRRFIAYTGAAGAATGAAWVAPSVLGTSSAFALTSTSDCTYAGTLHWADGSWASGGTTGTDQWVSGDLSGGIPVAPDNSSDGASVRFVARVGGTGNTEVYVLVKVTAIGPPPANSAGSPATTGGPRASGGYGPDEYRLLSKNDGNPATHEGYSVQFSFYEDDPITNPSAPTVSVNNLSFEIRDIDGSPSTYLESIWITDAASIPTASPNANIGGVGTAADPWRNISGTSNLQNGAGDITVSIPSTQVFTVHGTNIAEGENHGWSIGEISWGCS